MSSNPAKIPPKESTELRSREDLDRLLADLTDMSDETDAQASLRADMVLLAGQVRRRLTLERAIEVATYLKAAKIVAGRPQFLAQAQKMYQQALDLFVSYVNARNRLRYLSGVLAGFAASLVLLMILGGIARLGVMMGITSFGGDSQLGVTSLGPLFLFCGMGTFVSVLSRLSSNDLSHEVDARLVMISGAARPMIAIFSAMVVYVIIRNNFIQVHLGTTPNGESATGYQPPIGWVAAFLSGFSERFATDFIGGLPFAGTKGDTADRGSLPPPIVQITPPAPLPAPAPAPIPAPAPAPTPPGTP